MSGFPLYLGSDDIFYTFVERKITTRVIECGCEGSR